MSRLRLDRTSFMLILVVIMSGLSLFNLLLHLGRPFGGFLTFYNPISGGWNIDRKSPTWWPGMGPNGVMEGDRLLRLDGRPYSFNQEEIYATVYERGDKTAPLVVWRDGHEVTLQIPALPFSPAYLWDVHLPEILIGLGYWLIALVVYQARRDDPVNRVLAIACCLTAMSRTVSLPGLYLHTDLLTKFLDFFIIAVLYPFTGATLFHLGLLFPTRSRFYHPIVVYLLYGGMTAVAVMYGASRLLLWEFGQTDLGSQLDRTAFYASVRLAGIALVLLLLRAAYHALRPDSIRQRRQSTMALMGLLLGSPYFLPMGRLLLFGGSYSMFFYGIDLRYFHLAIPACLALAILRYQAFARSHALFMAVPIIGLSGVAASVTTIGWQQIGESTIWSPFMPALSMTLLVSLVWSSQVTWRGFFGRLFHWEQHNYDAVRRFGQELLGRNDLISLPDQIATALKDKLELELAAVWLWSDEEQSLDLRGGARSSEELPQRITLNPDQLPDKSKPLRLRTPGEKVPELLALMPETIVVIAPLLAGGKFIGLLGLGEKGDQEVFDDRSLEIVELLGQQASLFLLTAVQIEELRRVPRLLDEAQERERTKIAQELHDTIQQFLGRLPFFLEVSRQNVWRAPEEADELLAQCVTDVEDAAKTVRQIRNNLTASQLEGGLIAPLTSLATQFQQRTGIEVQLNLASDVDVRLTLNCKHALYRVIQQALDNTAEHAAADLVVIRLQSDGEEVLFHIADNGRGSSEAERQKAQLQGSFGLQSMAARIQNLGGRFDFSSRPGQGTIISGRAPAFSP